MIQRLYSTLSNATWKNQRSRPEPYFLGCHFATAFDGKPNKNYAHIREKGVDIQTDIDSHFTQTPDTTFSIPILPNYCWKQWKCWFAIINPPFALTYIYIYIRFTVCHLNSIGIVCWFKIKHPKWRRVGQFFFLRGNTYHKENVHWIRFQSGSVYALLLHIHHELC